MGDEAMRPEVKEKIPYLSEEQAKEIQSHIPARTATSAAAQPVATPRKIEREEGRILHIISLASIIPFTLHMMLSMMLRKIDGFIEWPV